mmetsp:Transcript_17123/g.56010  ORF Transcript_17123/g.56010 Transcript_17123/m.56010 type:complete len:272 (+) Transcript_17123:153-968(+)
MLGCDSGEAESCDGVVQRALADIFAASSAAPYVIHVHMQMQEVLNEKVVELLGARCVESLEAALAAVNEGIRSRAAAATNLNQSSSRSHCIITVTVTSTAETTTRVGQLQLVDLAGSERISRSGSVAGDRLKEAVAINRSLAALGDVLSALLERRAHVPYRNSKLTTLLQPSLSAGARVLMLAHCAREPESVAETLSTLNFASRCTAVEVRECQSPLSAQSSGSRQRVSISISHAQHHVPPARARAENLLAAAQGEEQRHYDGTARPNGGG